MVGSGGDELAASTHTAQPVAAHQSFDLASRHAAEFGMFPPGLLAGQFVEHLAHPIAAPADHRAAMHPANMLQHLGVTPGPRRWRAGLGRVERRRGDLATVLGEHPADRLDPEPFPMIIDERDHHGSRGSSSRAKKDDAANKISLARFNSRTSRSSSLILAASDVVVPGRRPASISACLHHVRNVSAFTPTRGPIRVTAAFNDNDPSCSRASNTSLIARCRSSSGYFLGAGMTSTLSWNQALHQPRDASANDYPRTPRQQRIRREAQLS